MYFAPEDLERRPAAPPYQAACLPHRRRRSSRWLAALSQRRNRRIRSGVAADQPRLQVGATSRVLGHQHMAGQPAEAEARRWVLDHGSRRSHIAAGSYVARRSIRERASAWNASPRRHGRTRGSGSPSASAMAAVMLAVRWLATAMRTASRRPRRASATTPTARLTRV